MYPSLMQKVIDLLSWKKTTTDTTIPALQQAIDALSASLLDKIYPVGSVYMSFTNKSPAEFLGGTWEALADGRVLIAANSTYVVNATGGATTHTLTTAQLPAHAHANTLAEAGGHSHTRGSMDISGGARVRGFVNAENHCVQVPFGAFYTDSLPGSDVMASGSNGGTFLNLRFTASRAWEGATSTVANHNHTITNASIGSGESHNNMQPYRAVYMWKRTA